MGSEFVVFVFFVVRHVGINLARYATMGVVSSSSARTSARRSAKEGASDAPYSCTVLEGWNTNNVFGRSSDAFWVLGAYTRAQPRKGDVPGTHTLPYSPMWTRVTRRAAS